MSRGPGRVEQAIVRALRVVGGARAKELAAYVFDTSNVTAAQLSSVRRALRRLEARRGIAPDSPAGGRLYRLSAPARSGDRVKKTTRRTKIPAASDPPRPVGAPIPLADVAVPYPASTRALGIRRNPVAPRRRRGEPGSY
jgi:hypothetical protein